MEYLEGCGLVKMDFLGLKTLTLIRNTMELLRKRGIYLKEEDIPEDDSKTFKMLSEGKSTSIFQFESQGMQSILKRAKPSSIEDLIALNALYRPGPMEFIDQYIDSKNGKIAISYPHPSLEKYLKGTYGVIVYQEQVMQVRRAMGKKKADLMEQQRPRAPGRTASTRIRLIPCSRRSNSLRATGSTNPTAWRTRSLPTRRRS